MTGDRPRITDQMPSAQRMSAQVKPRTSMIDGAGNGAIVGAGAGIGTR